MSRQDDIDPIRVGGPAQYAGTTGAPVVGFRITAGSEPLGLVWLGQQPTDDAAGVIPRLDAERARRGWAAEGDESGMTA